MDGRTNGWMDRRKGGRKNRWVNASVECLMGEQLKGQINEPVSDGKTGE
jgi:hypothetical protein